MNQHISEVEPYIGIQGGSQMQARRVAVLECSREERCGEMITDTPQWLRLTAGISGSTRDRIGNGQGVTVEELIDVALVPV